MIVGSDCLSKLSSSKAIPATMLRHNSTYVFSFQLTLSIISLLRKKLLMNQSIQWIPPLYKTLDLSKKRIVDPYAS